MYKNDIGINAGVIWRLLSDKGALSIRELGELTNYRESFIYLSLGWLSREDKIRFLEKDGAVYVELTHSVTEMYY
jgi:hypothetical protein